MATGTVVRVVRDKGFGFIATIAARNSFAPNAIDGDFDRVNEGQAVTFEEERSQTRSLATRSDQQ